MFGDNSVKIILLYLTIHGQTRASSRFCFLESIVIYQKFTTVFVSNGAHVRHRVIGRIAYHLPLHTY